MQVMMKVVTKTAEAAPMTTKTVKVITMAELMIVTSLNNVRRRNQEVSVRVTQALHWKHKTVAVQKTLAPTGTHSNALLTVNPSINRYICKLYQEKHATVPVRD